MNNPDKISRIDNIQQVVTILHTTMQVLNKRLLTLISLLLSSALFGWAIYDPKWERILAATLFSVGAWFLTQYKDIQ